MRRISSKCRRTWLHIPMDNTFGVNVVQGRANACNVERNIAFLEHIALAKVITQVATGLQIQHEKTMLSVKEKRSVST